jgi:hypothetical protein
MQAFGRNQITSADELNEYRMSNKEFRMMKFDAFVKSLPGRHSREGGSPEALEKTGFPPPRE